MISRGGRLAVLTLAALLGTTVFPTAAKAGVLGCGQIIRESVVLENDIGPCPWHGLIIDADDVTIDLNGHTVLGTPQPFDGAGILVANRRGVTVQRGTVSDFDVGVILHGGARNTVTQIVARNNVGQPTGEVPIELGDGILLLNSSNNVIRENVAENNGPFDGMRLLGASRNNLIERNVSQANNHPGLRNGAEEAPMQGITDCGFVVSIRSSPRRGTRSGRTSFRATPTTASPCGSSLTTT
jgi:hypothetical protein